MDIDLPFDWGSDRASFQRAVAMLCHRRFAPVQVMEIDGRGGDGGADLVAGDGSIVMQLKFFPDGINRGRRTQIKWSWQQARAVQTRMTEWILVVPCALSPHDWAFLERLRREDEAIRITVWDRAYLDASLAEFPDIANHLRRTPYVLESAKIVNQEIAVLTGGARDLAVRASALGERADHLNPHWRVNFARHGERTTLSLEQKHANAHEVEPIYLRLNLNEGADRDAHEQFLEGMRYGLRSEIVLDDPLLESAGFIGPPELGLPGPQPGSLTFRPAKPSPLAGETVTLDFHDDAGGRTASHTGSIASVSVGFEGATLELEFYDCISISIRTPAAPGPSRWRVEAKIVGQVPANALIGLDLLYHLVSAHSSRLHLANKAGAIHDASNRGGTPFDLEEIAQLRRTVTDIHRVQAHASTYFRIPELPDPTTSALLHAVCRALDGTATPDPRFTSDMTVTLRMRPAEAAALQEWIGQSTVVALTQDIVIQIGPEEVLIKGLRLTNAAAVIRDVSIQECEATVTMDWPGGRTCLERTPSGQAPAVTAPGSSAT